MLFSCGGREFEIPEDVAKRELRLFSEDHVLIGKKYEVQSCGDPEIFGRFLHLVQGQDVQLNIESLSVIQALITELGFIRFLGSQSGNKPIAESSTSRPTEASGSEARRISPSTENSDDLPPRRRAFTPFCWFFPGKLCEIERAIREFREANAEFCERFRAQSDTISNLQTFVSELDHRISEHSERRMNEQADSLEKLRDMVLEMRGRIEKQEDMIFSLQKLFSEQTGSLKEEFYIALDERITKLSDERLVKQESELARLKEGIDRHDGCLKTQAGEISALRKSLSDELNCLRKSLCTSVEQKINELSRERIDKQDREIAALHEKSSKLGSQSNEISSKVCEVTRTITNQIESGLSVVKVRVTDLESRISLCESRDAFKGIFWQLSRECGGNVHLRGVVNITASSDWVNKCYQVTDYGWNNWWYTHNDASSWICFDFKAKTVSPTCYSLKSDGYGYSILQWVVEGSRDGIKWQELDRRNTGDLNGRLITKTYGIQHTGGDSFRFLRIRPTGKNSGGTTSLDLSQVEFFGTLHR